MISAIVLINVQKGQLPRVVRQLGEIEEVTEIYSVAVRICTTASTASMPGSGIGTL